MVLSQCPTSLRSRKTIRDRGENRLRKSGQNTSIVYGAGAARRRRLRASLRRPLYAVDATRHSPRRPRVRDPGHRHRQVRLLLGDRRALKSPLERPHIRRLHYTRNWSPEGHGSPNPNASMAAHFSIAWYSPTITVRGSDPSTAPRCNVCVSTTNPPPLGPHSFATS